ncbi:MAG: N-methyl-D-aspartate receptor NMDAR2C subunit [Comamonadaceae bacterium]|nr:MAG: N-methyl-D-aspartate receptor NMDAR2C subunit [Comamonadaceae bacterium]
MNEQRAHRLRQWQAAWQALGVATPDVALFDALLAAYAEPQRHYHTLQHLGECLDWLDRTRDAADRPAEVALALWFHDAIYDVHAHDNEARSADWARKALTSAGVANDIAARVHALVMATLHNAVPVGRDAVLLVDIDLSILGAAPARFAEYEEQIRREYAHVPPELFAPRRREILQRFLAREPLFQTDALRDACEAAARRNLQTAIDAVA